MKFRYGYKTSDGERHEGVYSASSRDAVYAELKKQGIRPYFVELAPGLINRILSIGKRGFAILLLAVGLAVALVYGYKLTRTNSTYIDSLTSPQPRHQIWGDPALMAELARTDYAEVFANEGERILARFAQPGVGVDVKMSDASRLGPLVGKCLDSAIALNDTDVREVAELKRIVMWMKEELRRYLSDGIGTPERYVRRLIERQMAEIQMEADVAMRLRNEKDPAVWRQYNERLRAAGLKAIPVPQKEPEKGAQTPTEDF